MNEKSKTYIGMLSDILDQKKKVMQEILEITRSQHEIIGANQPPEEFEKTLEVKGELLERIAALDRGFDDAYAKVAADFQEYKQQYKNEILGLQEKIKGLTETGVKIQALEEQNRIALEQYLTEQRRSIKNFKLSNQAVSSYYKNMTGKPQGESYFMDKKK